MKLWDHWGTTLKSQTMETIVYPLQKGHLFEHYKLCSHWNRTPHQQHVLSTHSIM